MKLPNPQYFQMSEFEILHLQEIMTSIDLYLDNIRSDIRSRIDKSNPEHYNSEHEYQSHMDSLIDEMANLKNVEDTHKKLIIVGFYMVVESFTKKIMKWLFIFRRCEIVLLR